MYDERIGVAASTAEDTDPKKQFGLLLRLAIPVVLSQVSHTFVGLADTVLIGHTNNINALAGSALANNIFSVAILLGIGISYGATPKISEFFARKDFDYCRKMLIGSLFNNFLWTIVIISILFAVLPYANLLGQEAGVLQQAIPFFEWLIWGLPGIMLFQTFRQFYDGLGNTRPGMFFSLAANLLNIGLNYIFIFGKAGLPPMGIVGSGIATCIARTAMGLGILVFFLLDRHSGIWRQGWAKTGLKADFLVILNKMGIPIAMQFLFEVGAFSFTAIVVGQMGSASLAAHQVVITIASVTYMMASGVSSAATVRVGHFVGLENRKMVRLSAIKSLQMVTIFMAIMAVCMIGFRHYIPLLFVDNAAVVEASAGLLVIAGFFQLSDGIQVVGLGCLRGLSDVLVPTAITLAAYWVVAIPTGYYLGIALGYGLEGTWWALLVGLSTSGLLMLIRFFTLCKSFDFAKAVGH